LAIVHTEALKKNQGKYLEKYIMGMNGMIMAIYGVPGTGMFKSVIQNVIEIVFSAVAGGRAEKR
jgi:hypothetical protein